MSHWQDRFLGSGALGRELSAFDRNSFSIQAWVMERLGVQCHSKRQENMLLAAMREASHASASIDGLVAKARQGLFDKQLLVPAERTLHDICARAASDTEASAYRTICAAVTPDQRRSWEEALRPETQERIHELGVVAGGAKEAAAEECTLPVQ